MGGRVESAAAVWQCLTALSKQVVHMTWWQLQRVCCGQTSAVLCEPASALSCTLRLNLPF